MCVVRDDEVEEEKPTHFLIKFSHQVSFSGKDSSNFLDTARVENFKNSSFISPHTHASLFHLTQCH